MFYATAHQAIDLEGLEFEHIMEDISKLNEWGFEKRLEVTALSLHAYTHLSQHYALLASGASLGQGYGPKFVVRPGTPREQALAGPVAIPGELTTAFLTAQLYAGTFPYKVVPFETIIEVVRNGQASAGLVIHEGQLTYEREGLELLVDLGQWWSEQTDGLPLPLGVNCIRRDLGAELIGKVARVLERSIRYGLDHWDDALAYALKWGRDIDRETCDRFVTMYVNDTTLDFGEPGRAGVRELLKRAQAADLIDGQVETDFIQGAPVAP